MCLPWIIRNLQVTSRKFGASSLNATEAEFERFKQAWSQYKGAMNVWDRNWQHVAQFIGVPEDTNKGNEWLK